MTNVIISLWAISIYCTIGLILAYLAIRFMPDEPIDEALAFCILLFWPITILLAVIITPLLALGFAVSLIIEREKERRQRLK